MKIWMHDTSTQTHLIVKINCEAHSHFTYIGDFNDTQIQDFFISLHKDIDKEKNLKLLQYYGYLHLFISKKNLKK